VACSGVHQFNKVEQLIHARRTRTSTSACSNTEEIVAELGVPYRVVVLPTGDMSKASAKTYDVEIWFPSQERYRETASISNTTDFQARRLGTRYRSERGPEPVHTLNGTAVVDRMALAILENFQGAVPEVLTRYGAPAEIRR
jgi:seryl-tRNA synthetase